MCDFFCLIEEPYCRITGPPDSPNIFPASFGGNPVNCSDAREGLFETFSELVEIEVCRQREMVPENNKLLRCFQYMKMDSVSIGDYCWNGDCTNCQIWYRGDGGEIKSALACRLYVRPGMVITGLSSNLREDLNE